MNKRLTVVLGMLALSGAAGSVEGQGHSHGTTGTIEQGVPAPIRMSMDDLHAHGGVPPGWSFVVPPGNAAEGRKVFVSMECFACHTVNGEKFPRTAKVPRSSGPDLTGMGAHHPPAYFAESILNPNRVIVLGEGYTSSDGLSTMPSYADSMTLRQLVDVVAYLTSLTGRGMDKTGQHSHAPGSPHGDSAHRH